MNRKSFSCKEITQKIVATFIIAVMFMMDLAPLSQVSAENLVPYYSGNWVSFSSTNRALLEKMGESVFYKCESYIANTNRRLSDNQQDLINKPQCYGQEWEIQIPKTFLDSYDIPELDFSGIYLGSNYTLPSFSPFKGLKTLKFNDCSISNLGPFNNALNNGSFGNVTRIELKNLHISQVDAKSNPILSSGLTEWSCDTNLYNTYDPTTSISTTYLIKYDANGGTGAPATQTKVQGKSLQLSSTKPTRDNYMFVGWATSKNSSIITYQPGNLYNSDKSATLYAVWKKNDGSNNDQSSSTGQQAGAVAGVVVGVVPGVENQTITTYTTTTTTTTTTNYSTNVNVYMPDEERDIPLQTKHLVIEVTGYGWDPKDFIMIVDDGEKRVNVENKNGVGTYTVTKNGKYTIYAYYPGWNPDEWKWEKEIWTIDTTPPEAKVTINSPAKTIQEGGAYGMVVNVEASDSWGLKSIEIGEGNVINVPNGQKNYKASSSINKPGKYKIKVTDLAGNVKEEDKEIIFKDTIPVIKSYKVEKINTKTNNNSYVAAKSGDKIKITLKADRNIRAVGSIGTLKDIAITLNGVSIGKPTINKDTITFELDVDKALESIEPGLQTIKVLGITDECNNYLEEYTIPTKLLIDTTPPQIKKFEITGGETTSDKKAMFIQTGEQLTFNIYMNEKLSKNPSIKIAGSTYSSYYSKEVTLNKETCYLYTITIPSDTIIKNSSTELKNMEDGCIPVTIENLVDEAGNEAEEQTYDNEKKTTNKIYLIYGVYSIEHLFIVSKESNSSYIQRGDINQDGYITQYDSILMNKYLGEHLNKNYDEADLEVYDIDYDGYITSKDLSKLRTKVATAKNNIYKKNEVPYTFKVYTANEEIVKGEDLKWQFFDGERK